MNQNKSCGAVILKRVDDNRYEALLIRHLSGSWGFPKGHMEAGEDEKTTALREVNEETGYDVVLDTNFREISQYITTENVKKTVVYFVGKIISGSMKTNSDEISDIRWLSYNDALATLSHPEDVNILRHVKKYMSQFKEEE